MRIKQHCLMILFSLCVAATQAQYDSAIIRKQQALAGSVKKVNDKATVATIKVKQLNAQTDSVLASIQAVPAKYITKIDDKISTYSDRITGKTEKTLAKLSKWENKIKGLLEQASPETAVKLFGPGKMTFSTVLQKIKEGKAVTVGYKAKYDAYRDKLNTSMAYLGEQKSKLDKKLLQPLDKANEQLSALEKDVANTEAVEAFIKERKKELMNEAIKYIGKSKYLKKIDKEAYYYVETLRNYREIFSDPAKFEETATNLLKKIPAFNSFMERNSGLAGLLGQNTFSGNTTGSNPSASYTAMGYQSNAGIMQDLQQRNVITSIQAITQASASSLNSPLQQIKNQFPGMNETSDMPDFKPNEMKSKTFRQRLELGSSLQFGKATNIIPGSADIGLQAAYKLNNRSSVGIGTAYKLGLGTGINNIKFSFGGIALRSFLDWKLKGSFYMNGGFEYNYNTSFRNLSSIPGINGSTISLWKPAALLGLSKKVNLGKAKSNVMVLYDFLAKTKSPNTQALVFRVGYSF